MNAFDKVKAYFGMVPVSEYEDSYLADSDKLNNYELEGDAGINYKSKYEKLTLTNSPIKELGVLNKNQVKTNGSLALDYEPYVKEAQQVSTPKVVTLKPISYAEAKIIGEKFRLGQQVIIDLVEMSHEEAKRVVDFAAGLAFALAGTLDKVATKVFLLSPMGVEINLEQKRKIAARN